MRPFSILALILLAILLAGPALGAHADDSRPTVLAEDILAKIERGEPVEYDGVIVVGDLDLSGLDLPTKHVERSDFEIKILRMTNYAKLVNSSISIKDCDIRGNVNLGNAIFLEEVGFEGTNFIEQTSFSGSILTGDACFKGTQFSGGNANFCFTQFDNASNFAESKFAGGDANFFGAKFNSLANFEKATFSNYTYFGEVTFNGRADLRDVVFSGEAHFWEANFNTTMPPSGM